MIGRRHEDMPGQARLIEQAKKPEKHMPISDVVFLAFVAAAVGWVVVLAIRSNRRES